MRILFLEPFYGGSHRDFADGLRQYSRYRIDLVTLPARFWKWRMRGAALHFAHAVTDPGSYDLIVATDLMSVSDLRALWPQPAPGIILYMHENQLSYPVPEGERMDLHFGFTDVTSALASDVVVFNSEFHRSSFFRRLPDFLRRLPEYRPNWAPEAIEAASMVLYPGCRFSAHGAEPGVARQPAPAPGTATRGWFRRARPRIVWNHRWEFDKQPEVFFDALRVLKARGRDFEVVVLGENFQARPTCFIEAREWLGDRLVQFGYAESREAYLGWLGESDIVVSTARQENFGISVMEAMRYGCIPLLPARLSYPELIPEHLHASVLYSDDDELIVRLDRLVSGKVDGRRISRLREEVSALAATHAWENRIDEYDKLFRNTYARAGAK